MTLVLERSARQVVHCYWNCGHTQADCISPYRW